MTYDGLGRVKRTDLPNGSFSRVVRTPWAETMFDPNDTVDETVIVNGNTVANRWKTAAAGGTAEEQRALTLTQAHANTPTETHVDSLGRAFLVIAKNNIGVDDEAKTLRTRTTMDIEGQVLEVKDPLTRTCQTNMYSMAGKLLKETNLDKGARWYFHDVGGALIRKWDDRGQRFRLSFDVLRRATHLYCKQGSSGEMLLQRIIFGDSSGTGISNPATNNLRGKPIRVVDGAGSIKSENYDFKGNSLSSERKLWTEYFSTPEWSITLTFDHVGDFDSEIASVLDSETFTESRTFDALNRIVTATTPDGSIFKPTYNEAGLLEKVDVNVRGSSTLTPFVADIDYDAKGQRTEVTYSTGNFKTAYEYDPLTFRLTRVLTTRVSPSETLQDLRYWFDPVGNIVESTDGAQQSLLFTNGFATVPNKYVYDAVYRLIRGEGREHKSVGDVQRDHNDQAIHNLPHPNDPQAIRSYFEEYEYDKVGNILQMFHNAGSGANTWTRTYTYQSSPATNRLASHSVPGPSSVSFSYDAHGSMTSMPHLSTITWTPFDQMKSADTGGGGVVHFTYGADGQRVRKVRVNGAQTWERIYLGSYEIYREKTSGTTQLERQTLHVMDAAKRLAMVETKTVSGGSAVGSPVDMMRYQLGNHLGSAVLEVDEAGLIISYEEYSPYGSSAFRSSRSGVEVSAKRYRYVGLECDDETGLYSMGARYYAAWLGRWTSADPMGIGSGDGPGLYNYTRGSPVVLTDPGGMDPTTPGTPLAGFFERLDALGGGSAKGSTATSNAFSGLPDLLAPPPSDPNTLVAVGPGAHVPEDNAQSTPTPFRLVVKFDRVSTRPRGGLVTPSETGNNEYFIERSTGEISPTSRETLLEIMEPSRPDASAFSMDGRTRKPTAFQNSLVGRALDRLRRAGPTYHGEPPEDFYVEFGKGVISDALALNPGDPDAAIDQAERTFGLEVEDSPSKAPYHVWEAAIRTGKDDGWDKVQHFIRSATSQYRHGNLLTEVKQWGKEIISDEIMNWYDGTDSFDWKDMRANNRGEVLGGELFDKYHPIRSWLYGMD